VFGQELATSATRQAQKFGAKMAVARAIVQLRCRRRPYELVMDDGTVFFARTIVIATGACYNKPTAVALDRFAGRGVHYGATHIESQLCEGEEALTAVPHLADCPLPRISSVRMPACTNKRNTKVQ
jgi:thioredoxin reductase (NADPH)